MVANGKCSGLKSLLFVVSPLHDKPRFCLNLKGKGKREAGEAVHNPAVIIRVITGIKLFHFLQREDW